MEQTLVDGNPGPSEGSQSRAPNKRRGPQEDPERGEEAGDTPSQGTPPAEEEDELFITLRTDVVGIQYYAGLVGRGEHVMIRRQPENRYDPNACQVLNASNVQVGHIPRGVASQLAPLLDDKLVTVEGIMIDQNLDHARRFKLGMHLEIYGRSSLREVLEPELAWATPGGRGFEHMRQAQANGTAAPETGKKGKGKYGGETGVYGGRAYSHMPRDDPQIQQLLEELQKVSEDQRHADDVMNNLTANVDVASLPLHPHPPGVATGQLLVDLLPHQSQALQWMIGQETPTLPRAPGDPAVQFWVRQKAARNGETDYWLNVATKTPQEAAPRLGKGGILADGMGLGKTLTVLSLVLASQPQPGADLAQGPTLIVCPLSVLSNWEKQINDHVVSGRLSSYTYHGDNKIATAATLSTYDVVLTTYQTIAGEMASGDVASTPGKTKRTKTSAGALFKVEWKRLVADEGHQLKNPKARMTQAFASLQAERRWICTGTPIVNSSSDLGSLLHCLALCKPLDDPAYFKSLLIRPLRRGDAAAAQLLQALVGQILLRRTKESRDGSGQRIVDLPPIEFFQCPITLDEVTRKLYNEVLEVSARRLRESMQSGESAANVLSLLTRMRQLCLSAQLVPQSFIDDIRRAPAAVLLPTGPAVSAASLTDAKRDELIAKLRTVLANSEECAICYDQMTKPRITVCGHCFCLDCITHWITTRAANCPIDRQPVAISSMLELPPDVSDFIEPQENATIIKSAKIDELLKYLRAFDQDDKTLVFSQFTMFLDHVAAALRKAGIRFCRFDGSMPAKKRQEVIAAFQTPLNNKNRDRNPVVMLISLKSGAVGLNLTAASNVFLCDPWWQSAIEAQAVDRVHRMGQRKPVRVFQLIAEDTIESKVLDIQKKKDALVAKAFEKTSKDTIQQRREARFDDLKELLGVK